MITYVKAKELFESARNKMKGKPIGNNLRLVQVDRFTYGIKHHNTVIIKIHANNHFTYDNGGWYSSTTKKNMNTFGPARIFSEKGEWYIRFKNETIPYFNDVCTTMWGVNL